MKSEADSSDPLLGHYHSLRSDIVPLGLVCLAAKNFK
jgi:hypothetical protein